MRERKNNKNGLDWRPELESAGAGPEGDAASSLRRNAPFPDSRASMSNDTWSGLVHPRSVISFFTRNLRSIVTVAFTVFVLGLVAYMLLPAKYATKALILVDPRQPNITENQAVLSGIGGDAAALASYVQIISSDGFLAGVVREMNVGNDPDFAGAENEVELINAFRKNLSASRQGATYLVEVYYKASSGEKAAKYANGVAEAFVRDQRTLRTDATSEASKWLSDRLQTLQANLKRSEDAVAAYQAKNGIVDTGNQGTLDNQQLTSLVDQLATATTELAEARARYDQARRDGVPASSSNTQSGQFANLDQLLQEQNRLRRQAAELNQTLGSRHPQILANQQQQRIITDQIAKERSRLVRRTKQAYATAEAKKKSLEIQLADARQRAIQLNKATVELATLQREATANRNLYEQFLARFKATDEQSLLQTNEARIASAATIPTKSTKPSVKLVVVVLAVLGLGLGLLVSLLREAFAAPQPHHTASTGLAMDRHALTGSEAMRPDAMAGAHLQVPADHYLANLPDKDEETGVTDTRREEQKRQEQSGQASPVRAQQRARSKGSRVKASEPAIEAPAQSAGILAEDEDREDAILLTLDRSEQDIDQLLARHGERLHRFMQPELDEEAASLFVSAAQKQGGQAATSQLLRAFAIEQGFRPMVISLQSAPRMSRRQRQASAAPMARPVASLQEQEDYDVIPFVATSGLNTGGQSRNLAGEIGSLIDLCKDSHGFVILEAESILPPDLLEDLIALCDISLLVLEESELQTGDRDDWMEWAEDAEVGLVLNRAAI